MRGADLLMRSLAQSGVEICFANPGTSEMHLVAALDAAPTIRPVLVQQENVASGAADGWARVTGRPATTLLHLGPGLANAISNLHNARRARSPIVNLVGEHATFHIANDAPLQSDIAALARTQSSWVHTVGVAADMAAAGRAAVTAALEPPGAIATLILPADAAWNEVDASAAEGALQRAAGEKRPALRQPDELHIARIARILASGERTMLLIGARALRAGAVEQVARIAAHTGAGLSSPAFTSIARRGAGSVAVERLAYFPEQVRQTLADVRHLILVDTTTPVSFFAYPGNPVEVLPVGCTVHTLAADGDDVMAALDALIQATGAGHAEPARTPAAVPPVASGPITPAALAQTVAAVLPDDALVADEAITNRFAALVATAGARPHDWCCMTGGSLGLGTSMALGAALAAPGRRVLNLQADGSAMYTPQALWSQAREGVDVTTVILLNRRYRILDIELQRLRLTEVRQGARLHDLAHPDIDFQQLAQALGVPATRTDTAESLGEALRRSFATPGPSVVVAEMAP